MRIRNTVIYGIFVGAIVVCRDIAVTLLMLEESRKYFVRESGAKRHFAVKCTSSSEGTSIKSINSHKRQDANQNPIFEELFAPVVVRAQPTDEYHAFDLLV